MTKFARTLILAAIALAATCAFAQTDAEKAFAAIKNLPGTWEGKGPDGHAFQVTFKVVSGGSAVESEILVPNEDMISMFHMDGANRLMMTHYCGAGNQPRMIGTASADGKTMTYTTAGVTPNGQQVYDINVYEKQ